MLYAKWRTLRYWLRSFRRDNDHNKEVVSTNTNKHELPPAFRPGFIINNAGFSRKAREDITNR